MTGVMLRGSLRRSPQKNLFPERKDYFQTDLMLRQRLTENNDELSDKADEIIRPKIKKTGQQAGKKIAFIAWSQAILSRLDCNRCVQFPR